jgi:4-carboxymuconolactone decarboxylase
LRIRFTLLVTFQWLISKVGKVLQPHQELGKALREAGPIDEKTAHLIQLAAATAVRSEGSVHSHVKRALQAGATADEIYHSIILLTSTTGFPTVAASLSWAKDVIED